MRYTLPSTTARGALSCAHGGCSGVGTYPFEGGDLFLCSGERGLRVNPLSWRAAVSMLCRLWSSSQGLAEEQYILILGLSKAGDDGVEWE